MSGERPRTRRRTRSETSTASSWIQDARAHWCPTPAFSSTSPNWTMASSQCALHPGYCCRQSLGARCLLSCGAMAAPLHTSTCAACWSSRVLLRATLGTGPRCRDRWHSHHLAQGLVHRAATARVNPPDQPCRARLHYTGRSSLVSDRGRGARATAGARHHQPRRPRAPSRCSRRRRGSH